MYRLDDKRCLLSTADFFPPMVPDAVAFGRIAAANALSDIYAMGGTPLFALNLVCFPQALDTALIQDILKGGLEKCMEAGAVLAGGHSIYDEGIKYGLAVTGIADTDKYYRNDTIHEDDRFILTKPLGTGIITTAGREGQAEAADVAEVVASMERLNKYAAQKSSGYDVSACTDVTGFGLVVHTMEMTAGNYTAEIYCGELPCFNRVKHYIEDGHSTGGGQRNQAFAGERADTGALPIWMRELVFDPQTSGGLLIAVRAEQADALLREIRADDPCAAIIGRVLKRDVKEVVFK